MVNGADASGSVFVNYRREDTGQMVARFAEDLGHVLGIDRVFLDLESLRVGQNWQDRLLAEVDRSAIVFVLIGKGWLRAINESSGQRRLDEDGDWVRGELERALDKPTGVIVPLLVDGTEMPKTQHLPKSLERLGSWQARRLRTAPIADWKADIDRILVELGLTRLDPSPAPKSDPVANPSDRCITFRIAQAQVSCSIAGGPEANEPFVLAMEPDRQVSRDLDAVSRNRCKAEDIRNFGSELWLRLRPGAIDQLVSQVLTSVRDARRGVVEIRLSMPRELEGLPWEAIDDYTDECLSIAPSYSVSRLPPGEKFKPVTRNELIGGKLRLLAVIPGGSGLQPSIEWQKIQESLRASRAPVETRLLDGQVTPERLADALRVEKWDIVHFIGHGRYEEHESQGFELRLNGAEGAASDGQPPSDFWMPAATFVKTVVRGEPQIVVLNCCHSAGMDGFGGSLGSALLKRGVPAAVVMRYEIRDDAAAEFSRKFYWELLAGPAAGDVGLAVQEGRAALQRSFPDQQRIRSHITPVLYLAEGCRQLLPSLQRIEPARHVSVDLSDMKSQLELPKKLLDAMRAGHCLPILGPGILAADSVRRGAPSFDPHTLGGQLARASEFPDYARLHPIADTSAHWLVPVLFQRYCQHFEVAQDAQSLASAVAQAYRGALAPPAVKLIASWKVPGFVYTHLDGLLEAAVAARPGSNLRVLQPRDFAGGAKPMPGTVSFLNLRGHYSSPESMVLTELDEDRLLDVAREIAQYVADLMLMNSGTSLLFLGASPRDPIVRSLARRLLRRENARSRGIAYFVAQSVTQADYGYWKQLDGLEWLEAPLDSVIRGLSAAGTAATGHSA